MKTPTTKVSVRVHTTTMRIYGTMHLLPQGDVSGILNNNRLFFPMTDCQIFKKGLRHPPLPEDAQFDAEFLAVPKDKVLWLDLGDTNKIFAPGVELRTLYLLFPGYVLKGDFLILPSVRTSDFLVRAVVERPFQYFFNVELYLPRQGKPLQEAAVVERLTAITVNLNNVAGVFNVKDDLNEFPDF
ncbi:MAG: hypothetical protein KC422_09850 [Trueperaceae bacterium]|nr:hypothetical protein [Trueperaceae bacterium]